MENSKVCIIGNSNLKHISLISLYTTYFDEKGVLYDLIYVDRYGEEEISSANNLYRFVSPQVNGRINKIWTFLRFFFYVKKILAKNRYDVIITWQTTGAYLLTPLLLHKYSGQYVINVRDYICENKFPFNKLIKRLVSKSLFTTISSDGFRSFLPTHDYVKVNSVNKSILTNISFMPFNNNDVIKIGFVGNCRYFKENKRIIDALANDKRFELWYCGTNSDIFRDYAKANNIENVFTAGAFKTEETVSIMSSFDIINSAFGNDAMDNSTLIPIRLFTAISLGRPVLVNEKTQQQKEVESYNLGFVLRSYSGLGDSIKNYFETLDKLEFIENCKKYLAKAYIENEQFYNIVKSKMF